MLPIKSWLGIGLVAFAFAAQAPDSAAQAKYPNRPIRLLVPFAPGGGTDVVARIVGQRLSEQIGQPILVEAKPGAGGAIAVNELMRSDPDGYTLLLTTSSHATLPALSKLPWHPSNDFAPVAAVYSYPFVFITNSANSSRFKTLGEFLAYARANPGKINWGSSGTGRSAASDGAAIHQAGEGRHGPCALPRQRADDAGAAADDVQVTFDTQTLVLPADRGRQGRPRSPSRANDGSDKLPDVPTVREGGLDVAIQITNFVLAPKGTPAAIQSYLNKEFAAALGDKAVRERLDELRPRRAGAGREHHRERQKAHRRLPRHLRHAGHRNGHQGGLRLAAKRNGRAAPGRRENLGVECYSTLAPENSTTFFHFSVSDAMILPKSAGVPPIGAPPRSASRAFIFGSASAFVDRLVEDRR